MSKSKSNILNLKRLDSHSSRMVDDIAKEIRDEYIKYLAKIGKKNEGNIDWWVLNFVCRNTFLSNLFRNICYLVLIKRNLDSGNIYDEIFVGSLALKNVIEKYYSKYHFKVTYKGKSLFLINFKRIFSYFKIIINIFFMWESGLVARIYRRKTSKDKAITLIDTFILKNSFNNGSYTDRYYSSLMEYLYPDERKNIYFVPTYYGIRNYNRLFLNMRKSKQNFFLKEDYLKIRDYIFAVLYPFRANKIRVEKKKFMGFDIYPLILEEIADDSISNSSVQGLLNYRFAERLKSKRFKIKTVINFFENQSIDHGFNSGFRKYFPESLLIGYQGFPLADNYLSLYVTDQEKACKVVPDEIRVIGRGYIKSAKRYCSKLVVKTAPAFRYAGLWDKQDHYSQGDKFNILITLPILMSESDDIIDIVLKAAGLIGISDYSIQIKPHPAQNVKKLKIKWQNKLPRQFSFINGDFDSCIREADVLISTSSTTCLETIARGIPVIVIGNNFGLTKLYIPPDIKQDIWKLCYGVEEVAKAIKFYMGIDKKRASQYRKTGRKIRREYFEPVTRSSTLEFLNLL